MKIFIKNIKGLVQVREDGLDAPLRGEEMNELPIIENAFLAIEDGRIADYGKMSDWPGITDWRGLEVIDVEGKYVFPTWCDSHTHIVFAAYRESEFVDRIKGLTYQEIANKGGGILNSAKRLQQASEDELYDAALERVKLVASLGTGAVEIKSGYGLTLESELKMLRVIKRLRETTPLTIKSTFLGAHAIPMEFREKREDYIKLVIEEMIPAVAEEKLADYIDAFCETNYFSPDETAAIIEKGKEYGMKPKIHVNQFTSIGGIKMATELGALTVDHLEEMKEEDFTLLANSSTIPVALPSCSFFLGIPYAPVKEMIAQNLPVTLATDYNPGSTPSGNMNFVNSLACVKQKLTPAQAFNASTVNAAFAMEVEDELGWIARGKRANLFITKAIPSIEYMPYSFGENCIESVILNGELQK